jgi:ATP adenylyltransferase
VFDAHALLAASETGSQLAFEVVVNAATAEEAHDVGTLEMEHRVADKRRVERTEAIWDYRRLAPGDIPGTLRYDVLARAGGHCEACGVSAQEERLDVDHIVPRNQGGTVDPENLQALCRTCNAQKRDRDSTNFVAIRASYDHREAGCAFCELPEARIVSSNRLAVVVRDLYPVTDGHTLIITKRHVIDFFDLYPVERSAIDALIAKEQVEIRRKDSAVAGFDVGVNAGAAAGQTVFHVHLHLIPRRTGDVADPRGGVRGVIPGRHLHVR